MDYYITYNELGEYGFLTPDLHGLEYCEQEGTLVSPDVYEYLMTTPGLVLDTQAIEADGEVRIEHAQTVIQDVPEALIREGEREKARNMLFDLLLEDYLSNGKAKDEQKKTIMALYDKWATGLSYQKGDRVSFNEAVYENVSGVNNGNPKEFPSSWRFCYSTMTTNPEPRKIELELEAQKEYNVYLESTVLELADMLLLSSLM